MNLCRSFGGKYNAIFVIMNKKYRKNEVKVQILRLLFLHIEYMSYLCVLIGVQENLIIRHKR